MRVTPSYQSWQNNTEVGESLPRTEEGSSTGFANELKANIKAVDQFQHEAESAMQEGAVKGAENIHETMIKLEEADLSLRFLLKVRNKALDSYQEIMRMQV